MSKYMAIKLITKKKNKKKLFFRILLELIPFTIDNHDDMVKRLSVSSNENPFAINLNLTVIAPSPIIGRVVLS